MINKCVENKKLKIVRPCNKVIKTKNFIIRKISNPTKGEKEADGLIKGGNRGNNYLWAMAESKNYIYMGSNKNIISSFIRSAIQDPTLATLIIAAVFKGDISTTDTDTAAEIFRYNKLNNKIELVYKSEYTADGISLDNGYRSAVAFKPYNEDKESIFIGSFGTQYSRILKFKENYNINVDKPEVVFSDNTGTSSIRAMAVHDNKLYAGLLIANSDLLIIESDIPNENTWNTVADLSDFLNIPNVDSGSAAAGGIFDLISYNGYLYAFIASGSKPIEDSGFLVFKGKHIGMGAEGSNSYGWIWEMIVGPNAKYEAGVGSRMYAIGTPFKYKASDNKEYVYVGTFSNVIQSMQKALTFDFSYLYNNFLKPAQLYRFDENDDWELVIGTVNDRDPEYFDKRLGNYKAGFVPADFCKNYSSNQYIWRMEEYNGKLFAGTFDSSTLYDYFIPSKIPENISHCCSNSINSSNTNLNDILTLLIEFLNKTSNNTISLSETIILRLFNDFYYYPHSKISLSEVCLNSNSMYPSEYLESFISDNNIDYDLNNLRYFKTLLPEDLNYEIENLIADYNYIKYRNVLNSNFLSVLDNLCSKFYYELKVDEDKFLKLVYDNLSTMFGTSIIDEITNTLDKLNNINDLLNDVLSKIKDFLTSKNILKQIYYIKELRRMINKAKKGFNLYASTDGINFFRVTSNGFNDKFNYGLRTFLSSDDGLYIGTANPFYGAQLWRLTEIL